MNIAIITSNDLYRESLKTVLNQIPRFSVTVVCRNWSEAAEQITGKKINVVLLDSSGCENDPGGFVKQIHKLSPSAKILMLLDHSEECWRVEAMRSGADDAVPQHADKNILEEHIRGFSHRQPRSRKREKLYRE